MYDNDRGYHLSNAQTKQVSQYATRRRSVSPALWHQWGFQFDPGILKDAVLNLHVTARNHISEDMDIVLLAKAEVYYYRLFILRQVFGRVRHDRT